MNDYTPNSHKFKESQKTDAPVGEKRASKVVQGAVKTKQKSGMYKLADIFIKEDVANVKSFVINDIVIPTIRDTIWSIFTNSLEMFLYPGGGRGRKRVGSDYTYTSYDRFSDRDRRERSYYESEPRPKFNGEDLVFATRGDAEAVLREMEHLIMRYKMVRVGDLYDMADRTAPYTANDYGWTNLRTAEVVRVRDGYILKLPKALPID